MKRSFLIAFASFFGLVLGWIIGYLRIPYFEGDLNFVFGFIAGISTSVLLVISVISTKIGYFADIWTKKNRQYPPEIKKRKSMVVLVFLFLASSFLSHFTIFSINNDLK